MAFLTGRLSVEAGLNGGLRSMIRDLPDTKFEEVRRTRIGRAREALRDEVKKIAWGPSQKLYWNQDLDTCVTQGQDMHHRLKKFWFTEAKYSELDEEERVALWTRRYDITTKDMASTKNTCC